MYWKFPLAFWLLIPWVALILYYFLHGRKKNRAFRVSLLDGFKLKNSFRSRWVELPAVLQFLSLLLLILALARPQAVDTQVNRSAEGIDIVIVLDTSDSMLIEDMNPGSRIEVAKRVIKNFINGLVYDRVGLIVFAGESYTRVPLTLDYGVLLSSVDEVKVSHYDPYIKKGTAIGVALANAVARLRKSSAKSKVIVFLTDGEDNVGVITPQTALDIVQQYEIRVYTIGVGGRAGPARIRREVKDHTGRKRIVYQRLKTKINEELLKKIAQETGGKYFRANNARVLELIFSEISRLEKSVVETQEWREYKDLFPGFLEKATLLYLVSLLLSFSFFWRVI
ncbi:MAG: VWA domain-containing protein [Oligoflexia bacterium]|nr:VWA domain-containing protein [Bdellovibrionales bacterium]MYE07616.1 VWA domain-containing protein [Oligoflexia bacterium]